MLTEETRAPIEEVTLSPKPDVHSKQASAERQPHSQPVFNFSNIQTYMKSRHGKKKLRRMSVPGLRQVQKDTVSAEIWCFTLMEYKKPSEMLIV